VVTFENPVTLSAVLQLDACSVIASPVRSVGFLTAIAVTLSQSKARRSRDRYIGRLEQKQSHQRFIQQATQIVMESRGASEASAYQLLRTHAMHERESIESLASGIVKARSTLESDRPPPQRQPRARAGGDWPQKFFSPGC